PPTHASTLFPYTTLFRSHVAEQAGVAGVVDGDAADVDHEAGGLADGDAVNRAEGCLVGARHRVRVECLNELHPAPVEGHGPAERSEEHTSELQSREKLVC